MKLAVIFDIHGNATALDAVLGDLERHPADAMVCLGDCVQGGAEPAESAARLRALGCPIVMGNADACLLSGIDTALTRAPPARRAILDAVREWSLAQLSAADRAFIAAFAPTARVDFGSGATLLGFHGTPASFDEILLPTCGRSVPAAAPTPTTRSASSA